jgi:oxaloacetate decarboxylase beta subunit
MPADKVLQTRTLMVLGLGLMAFAIGTAGGVLLGKIMSWISKDNFNPMIGAAGVSAVPMSARIVQHLGLQENKHNHLLMHAMGANVAGVIGSAIAGGYFLSYFGQLY